MVALLASRWQIIDDRFYASLSFPVLLNFCLMNKYSILKMQSILFIIPWFWFFL